MKISAWFSVLATLLLFSMTLSAQYRPVVMPGVDVLLREKIDLVAGKRVGLITNPTGFTADLRSTVDALAQDPRVKLVALFGPEHGVRGDMKGGQKVENFVDPKTGIPVYSLYGKVRKPTPEMLKNVDVLVFDIQDIGVRPYTYIYTMALSMEAAAEKGIPFLVLDRPNPMGGLLVEGPMLREAFKSFIGLYPIPYVHGMTAGELARLFNEEFGIGCDLTVVTMKGWHRSMFFRDTGLLWIPASPHVPRAESCFWVAATGGFGELGTISEGVGTPLPFELCGAPWVDGERLARALNAEKLPGVFFRPVYFRPYYFRFKDELCGGVQIHITDFRTFRPMKTQIHILTALRDLFPEHDFFAASGRLLSFDRAMGSDEVRKAIAEGKSAEEILVSWQKEVEQFKSLRSKYLLYPE